MDVLPRIVENPMEDTVMFTPVKVEYTALFELRVEINAVTPFMVLPERVEA